MEGTSAKLSILVVVLVAFASFLSPFTAEARHKHVHHRNCHHRVRLFPVPPPPTPTAAPVPAPNDGIPPYQIHGCGYPCSDSNDCDSPCTVCCANQTCCFDEPFVISDPFPSFAPSPSIEEPVPAPVLAPTDGIEIPPYQIHGCGYSCSDSNDCDWPCTICCANQTCCYDEPFFIPPLPSPAPAPLVLPPLPSVEATAPAVTPALAPSDGIGVPPYQIHGYGYPCRDSNDCDAPCTICCANQTCCYDEFEFIPPFPSSDPMPFPPWSPSQPPSPPPSTGDETDDDLLAPSPPYYDIGVPADFPPQGYEFPPYQVHGCGYPCSDSNDCDAPCTLCCANQTCCYKEPVFIPPFPSSDPMPFPPWSPSQPPSLPPSTGDETDDDLLAPPTPYYDIGVPADVPPPGFEFPPYQVHGCGWGPCKDSNDCDWPCTSCCADHTCCHEEDMFR